MEENSIHYSFASLGTIVNNVLAEQETTHPDAEYRIDAGAAMGTPLNMPANSANLRRWFHREVYDKNLGKSLQVLWDAARPQFVDANGAMKPVPRWDGIRTGVPLGEASDAFVADDELLRAARSIREIDEGITRRQYGYDSVDDYYAAASSDQRLGEIKE